AGFESGLAGVWDAARRDQIARAFAASRLPFASDSLASVNAALDSFAGSWVRLRTEACRATRVEQTQSEELLDLRMRCLDGRRTDARALVDRLATADDASVRSAAAAVSDLASLESCNSAALLRAPVKRPEGHAMSEAIQTVKANIAAVRALRLLG